MEKVIWSASALDDLKQIHDFIFKGYRIIYQLKASHVEIITVIHGSKLLK